MYVAMEEVDSKRAAFAAPLHRLRWLAEFAFVPWERVQPGIQMDWRAGLFAFAPETASWRQDPGGHTWAFGWPDDEVLSLQPQLQTTFTAVADGTESVPLARYPALFTWQPPPHPSPPAVVLTRGEISGAAVVEAQGFVLVDGKEVRQDAQGRPLLPGQGVGVSEVQGDAHGIVAAGVSPAPYVRCEHEDGLNGVKLVLLLMAILLREFPDRMSICQAPRLSRKLGGGSFCGKVFVGRTDQKWCSRACAVRAHRLGASG